MILDYIYRYRVFLGLLILVASALISGCTSKEEAAKKFYARGQKFYAQGEMGKARIEFLNAIQQLPQYAQAYYALGLLAKDSNDIPLVFENMSIAMRLDENNIDARINVAQLLVYSQRFDEALELTEEIFALKANHIEGLRIKVAALIGQKEFTKANDFIDEALRLNPQDDAIYTLKAVLAKDGGEPREALLHLNRALELSKNNTQYLLLRASLHRELKDNQALEKDYRSLIEISPEQAQYSYDLSQFLVIQKRYGEAEEVLRLLIKKQPNDIVAKQRLIETILVFDQQRARQTLDNMIVDNPEAVSLLFFKAKLFLVDKKVDQALALLGKLSSSEYDEPIRLQAHVSSAEVHIYRGEVDKALTLLHDNLKIDPQHEQSLLLIANNALNNRDFNTAIAHLRNVLRNNPSSEPGLVLLGHVYLQNGSELLADDSFRQVLELNPGNIDAAMPVARALMSNQDLERSDNIISSALARNPKEVKLIALLAQIKLSKKEWPAVLILAERLQIFSDKKALGHNAYVHYLRGRVYLGQSNFSLAIDEFKQALSIQPELTLALQGMVSSYIALGDENALLEYLNVLQTQHSDLIPVYLMSAQVLKQQGHVSKAEEKINQALTNRPDWVKGYSILADYQKELVKEEAIPVIYKKGLELNPNNTYLQIRLASHYESSGAYDLAADIFKNILQHSPDNLLAINNYSALLLDKIATKESMVLALELSEVFKNSNEPLFVDTYGWALAKNGQFVEAEKYLRKASEQITTVPEIYYHLGFALKYLGRTQESNAIFKRALKKVGDREELEAIIKREMIN